MTGLAAAMALVSALCGFQAADGAEAKALAKVHACAACHGAEGVSHAEIFPNLAGQQPDYTIVQLTALRARTRRDRDAKAYMWGMAARLDDPTIARLAAYYADRTPPAPHAPARPEAAAGKAIYEQGVADRGVLACASCHGDHAEGDGAAPRLAGQHRDYLIAQLRVFSTGARENAAMNLVAKSLTAKDVRAVAAYLAAL